MMNELRRELAPITADAWAQIDEEARNTLKLLLAGRRVADFDGPRGWAASAVALGRVEALPRLRDSGVQAALRKVQPLVELRAPLCLQRSELEDLARGARDADLGPVTEAARAIAQAEDRAIFHGYAKAGIVGICEAAGAQTLPITDAYEAYPGVVVTALNTLRNAGVDGPYAIALGPRCYAGLTQTITKAGYPVIQHLQRLLDGPIIWGPAVDGAVVLSLRGGDFELVVGRDLSVGYQGHTADAVDLYIEESFTFRVLAPEAAVPLAYPTKK